MKVNFWDLSGHREFYEVRNEFHQHVQGVLLVYDVNNLESFQKLDNWLKEMEQFGGKPYAIIVCANKVNFSN